MSALAVQLDDAHRGGDWTSASSSATLDIVHIEGSSSVPMFKRIEQVSASLIEGAMHLSSSARRIAQGRCVQQEVMRRGKVVLWRASPEVESFELGHDHFHVRAPRIRTPLLLIPPLMVRPHVYDLRSSHSLTKYLIGRGFDVFTLDLGAPTRNDRHKSLSDYVFDDIAHAVAKIRQVTSAPSVGLLGYCMGGLFALMYAATHSPETVAVIIAIGSPIDFRQSWLLATAPKLGRLPVRTLLAAHGNIPGRISSLAFRSLSLPNYPARMIRLLLSLHDQQSVDAHISIQEWLENLVDCPGQACRELIEQIIIDNALFQGKFHLNDVKVDLSKVTCPVLAFGGQRDILAPPKAVSAILSVVGSHDKAYHTVPGGHVAVIDGQLAPSSVWAPSADWLHERLAPATCPVR